MTIEARNKLARYVPRVSAEWDLNASGLSQELEGTLCYIDISGFTNLSEKLARRGRIGAEELTDVLNHVFARMLALAYDRGGSLLKFGGDALLLLFRGADHETQACSASVEMQAALREAADYETSAGKLRLKMSVGLHSGTVHLFRVGGSHKELILTGPAASRTTEMEETAVAGEILISSATRAAIPKGAAPVKKGDGWLLKWRKPRLECCGWSPRVSLEPEAVAAGLPVALREYLEYGVTEPEHRIATVAFIKYEGIDALMDKGRLEAVAQALDELVRNVQGAADDEGVTFLATDIDQDGGKIILVGGVPGAQEDDEGRVMRTVRRIAESPGVLTVRIGVNQGHVFVGEIGTDFRATYTIMGDTVNLAARLMAAASAGEIYASPRVLDRSLTLFETTALEPFYVKGKEHPVQAYAVGQETGSQPIERGGELLFVGRVEEVAQLTKAIAELKAGKGGAIAVVGETGIGKTRLVDQALPHLNGTHHVNIRSEPYGSSTPYRALRDPLRGLLGVDRGSQEEMAARLLESVKALDPGLLPMLPFVAEVAMVEVESTPEADAIEPKFRQERTAEVLVELFEKALAGPVLFEAEDGHWMDDASAHVLRRVVGAAEDHPWLVLTTRREQEGGFEPVGDEIRLGPLSDGEAKELIIQATEAAPLRPHDLDAIVGRAGGLPLFLEEILGAVRQAGSVDSLPDSLDAVVGAQIDALPPLPRRLLRYASVLGRSFRLSNLNDLLADEQIEVDEATLDQLVGFLDLDGAERLRFRHALLRDVAYEGLSFRRRTELHLRAGELAEVEAGAEAETIADVLALHFSRAGEYEKTWRYARIAGDQAVQAYANVEAAEQYERALEAARTAVGPAREELSEVWTSLATVREQAGLFDRSFDALREATRLSKGYPLALADLHFERARARIRVGAYSSALRETATGLRQVKSVHGEAAARARTRLVALRANLRMLQGHPREAVRLAKKAVEEAEANGEKEALARAYSVLDGAYQMLGEPELAVHEIKALEILKELGHLPGVALMANNLGVQAYADGKWDEAISWYAQSQEAFHTAGNEPQAAMAGANMGEVFVSQRKFSEAKEALDEAKRVLRASNLADFAVFADVQLARLSIEQGRTGEAVDALRQIVDEAMAVGHVGIALEASIYAATAHVHEGDPTSALAQLGDAEHMAGEEAVLLEAPLARVRGSALAALGRAEEAAAQIAAGLVGARDQGLPYEEALLLLMRAELTGSGDSKTRLDALEEAQGLLQRLGVLVDD